MLPNPAVTLYKFWREVIRFHQEAMVIDLRKQAEGRQNGVDIERWALDTSRWHRGSYRAPLDYRMSLSVVGLSARHIDPGLLVPTLDEYEPVISLNVRYGRGGGYSLMTLFPNGDFELDRTPADFYQIFPRWTFFKTGYVAGRRVWTLPLDEDEARHSWVQVNESDYTVHRPYVPNHSFIPGCNYRLEADARGRWKFASNSDLTSKEERAVKALATGHDTCERRYARYQRKAEQAVPEARRQKLAIYVPKTGRVTGMEAVNQFAQHLRIYPAAAKPEEAPDGNRVVASAVHQ